MWARMYSSYLLGSDVGSLWSQGWEETPISIGCEIRNFWKGWRKYAVGSPGPSDIETGIEWNRMRPEAKALLGKVWELIGYFSLCLSLLLLQAYLLGPDVKPLLSLSQGLEEISVSVGCEFGNLGRGDENMHLSYSSTPICGNSMATFLWLWCGTIMVARIRRKFCQYRMWNLETLEGWRKYASLFYSSTPICWVPMWDHYGRKA